MVHEQSPDANTESQVQDRNVNFTSFADLNEIKKDHSQKDMATDNMIDEHIPTLSKHDSSEFVRSFKPFDSLRDNSSMFNTKQTPFTFTQMQNNKNT